MRPPVSAPWQDGRVTAPNSFYDAVGGEPTFRRLVDKFYEGVAEDPLLRPMYPEEDLGPAADRLTLFLMQYWGGPNTYSASRGHPRLRMRHAPFVVDAAARDAWLLHMRVAVESLELPKELHDELWTYLERAAYFMVNKMDELS
ncbi:globin [Actinoplanes bogorensis]|uniref:Globin n=1 Tax=Paractinoplanes bogorensis TaxID=1610840 RepID=A0ABS5Z1D5_9ACTN|nr:globin [Actinoplanes bogorensis]